ncbi:hypothetical protein NQ318_009653 [Aromia moschata]|uniref:Tetraspanin n=1 Tax=Aromia moschata TaxID=1265417 RepID=A0AAV8Y0E9_9CUCU|nr:hypothetical protein NQ318_009653 [Aromia moschata]
MTSLKCKEIFCIIYSALLFISGILLITFSVILSYRVFYHFNFIPSSTIGPFIVIFILGFLHLFLTWLGIKGPTREHNFHIILFMIFTLILLISEFAVGIWTMMLWSEVSVESYVLMSKSFNYATKDATPISCTNPDLSNGTVKYIYEKGCREPLIKYVKYILMDGALIGFISGLFQALGIFAFYTFFKTLRKERAERMQRMMTLQREQSIQGQQSQQMSPQPTITPPAVITPPPTATPPVTTS